MQQEQAVPAAAFVRKNGPTGSCPALYAVALLEGAGEVVHVAEVVDAVLFAFRQPPVFNQSEDDASEILGARYAPPGQDGPGQKPPAFQRQLAETFTKLATVNMPGRGRFLIAVNPTCRVLQPMAHEFECLYRISTQLGCYLLKRLENQRSAFPRWHGV